MPSGPVALFSLTLRRSLRTPALETIIFGMGWAGFLSVREVPEGVEKTCVKNVLNMLAFVSGFWISVSPCFRSEIPVLSVRLLLT